MVSQSATCYGFWPRADPDVAMREGLPKVLPRVMRVVLPAAGSMPCGSKCRLATGSLVWMMALLSSMTEGTLPRVSTAPTTWPLVRLAFSPLCPRGRSPFMAASVDVSITVLEAVCRTGPTLECTRLQGGGTCVEGAKVTAPAEVAEEEAAAPAWTTVVFNGTEAASAMTDFVSADSLASDITYSVFMGLVVVTVGEGGEEKSSRGALSTSRTRLMPLAPAGLLRPACRPPDLKEKGATPMHSEREPTDPG